MIQSHSVADIRTLHRKTKQHFGGLKYSYSYLFIYTAIYLYSYLFLHLQGGNIFKTCFKEHPSLTMTFKITKVYID